MNEKKAQQFEDALARLPRVQLASMRPTPLACGGTRSFLPPVLLILSGELPALVQDHVQVALR